MRAVMSTLLEVCLALLLLQGVTCDDPPATEAAPAADAAGNGTAAAGNDTAAASGWLQVVYLEADFPSADGNGTTTKNCAGSMIGSSAVLTAAVCVYDPTNKTQATIVRVHLGSQSRTEGGSSQTSAQFTLHDEDKPSGLALIKLNSTDPMPRQALDPIESPGVEQGAQVSTTGWAQSSAAALATLRSSPMTVASFDACQGCSNNATAEDLICANYTDATDCTGDLGSPLVKDDHQVGVLVSNCVPCGGKAVYADLAKSHDWLVSQLDADETTEAPTTKAPKDKNKADVAGLSWSLFCALCLALFAGAK